MADVLNVTVPRRTQSERSAKTRQLIMDATVAILEEEGLGRATTVRIQERAGVSRGRLLHHFPSRSELLVAAVQHLAKARLSANRQLTSRKRGRARIRAAIDALWMTYEGPLFWAAMELWLGSRTDPTLGEYLLPEEEQLGVVVYQLCDDLFGASLVSKPMYAEFRDLLISSMRGAAMTYAFHHRPKRTDPHRAMWLQMAIVMLQPETEPEEESVDRTNDRSPRA
jgi:AcrR family transcriptional regulator